jgi:putative N6-adenine-specific DNA methylase
MSTIEGAAKLARTFGECMAEHPCAGVYAITADMEFEAHYGKRATKRRKMYNGMIPCQIYMYYDAPNANKGDAKTAKPMPTKNFDGRRTNKNDGEPRNKTLVWRSK